METGDEKKTVEEQTRDEILEPVPEVREAIEEAVDGKVEENLEEKIGEKADEAGEAIRSPEAAPEATPEAAPEAAPEEAVEEKADEEKADGAGEAIPAPVPAAAGKRKDRRAAKQQAKEDVRELAREVKEEKRTRRQRLRQQKQEEREKYPTFFLRQKARRLRWKKSKAERRQALKDRFRDAPWIIRVCRLYLLKPFIALLIVAAVIGCLYATIPTQLQNLMMAYMDDNKNNPVSQEEILKLSPIDEEGAKRIDAVAPVDKKDTWTISVYIVGADLEDMDENDLSQVVSAQAEAMKAEATAKEMGGYQQRLSDFTEELGKKDLDIPAYLYYPTKPVKAEGGAPQESGPVVADSPGAASTDIGEMTSDAWSDNINIVIQTGGATRWSNGMINPNRTQRFLYSKGEFTEVDDLPLQPAADPKTLTSFLNFCKKEYPADHNMLVLWNHGGGAFGYGMDSLSGAMMSLKDVRAALAGAYKPNEKKPPFDIIGFDACLMSSLEVTHAMNGFASYYAVSEETEPGDGWDYGPWLTAMTKDPTMNAPQVARAIADSYMDFYMTQNVNVGWLFSNDVCFSVLDASKTEDLYRAWCALTKRQLIDAAADNSVLSEIGRCSDKSTHFLPSYYNLYNTIDLGNYVDLMADTYPKECSRIKNLIGEAVMYHRESGSLSDAQGISIYLPGTVETYPGLAYCLDYIYNISDDPSTQALYYYKIAGCLNEDMEKYLATLTDKKARPLDLKSFTQFERTKPVLTDTGFAIPVSEDLQSMLQSYSLEAARYDEETGLLTNYGRDETVRLDGEGNLDCEFDGTWICYDGVPLATEVAAATDSTVEYRSKVLYNGKESYLCFTWDRDTEEFTVTGIRGASDLTGLVSNDPINYLINSRMNTEVKKGDVIVPVYEVTGGKNDGSKDAAKETEDAAHGDEIKVSKRSRITVDKLPSGYYVNSAVISDSRGDVYYSQVVGNDVSGGKVKTREVNTGFYGREYK